VPLLLIDLDNTLVDRAGAFDRWAREFMSAREVASAGEVASARGGGAADAEWLVAADRDGLESRERLAAIFWLAAARAGQPLDGAWMIGDSAKADINGARHAGLPGIWLHRGRPWPLATCQPAHVADDFPHAIEILLALGG
jgi:FMN phosphatase YigB (HAD superfamily)